MPADCPDLFSMSDEERLVLFGHSFLTCTIYAECFSTAKGDSDTFWTKIAA